jgi:hypothetical protein
VGGIVNWVTMEKKRPERKGREREKVFFCSNLKNFGPVAVN